MHEKDKADKDLDLTGDKGLSNNWGSHFKAPHEDYVRSFVRSLKDVKENDTKHNVSPRHAICEKATANVQKMAESITKSAIKRSPTSTFTLGDVVLASEPKII